MVWGLGLGVWGLKGFGFEEVGAHIYRNSGEAAGKGKLGVVEGCNGLYQTLL